MSNSDPTLQRIAAAMLLAGGSSRAMLASARSLLTDCYVVRSIHSHLVTRAAIESVNTFNYLHKSHVTSPIINAALMLLLVVVMACRVLLIRSRSLRRQRVMPWVSSSRVHSMDHTAVVSRYVHVSVFGKW